MYLKGEDKKKVPDVGITVFSNIKSKSTGKYSKTFTVFDTNIDEIVTLVQKAIREQQ